MSKWSAAEETRLTEEFQKAAAHGRPIRSLGEFFPGRTHEAIRTKIRDLKGDGKIKGYDDYIAGEAGVHRVTPAVRETNLSMFETDEEHKYFVPIGDIHDGHPQCDIDKVLGYRDWILENNAWTLLMGDLMEYGTRKSVGASVYEQVVSPQEQRDQQIDIWRPVAEAGLIVGMLTGNHEERAFKESNYDPTREMAGQLNVPYLRYSGFVKLKVQDQNYIVYGTHGSSGATLPHTKMKKVFDLATFNEADVYLMGHVHELMESKKVHFKVNTRNKSVEEFHRHFVLTGHFLNYHGSYSEMKNMQPSKTGAPRIRFEGNSGRDIHVSI